MIKIVISCCSNLNYTLARLGSLHLGFRTWRLVLFSTFQRVRDVVPRAQSWKQFRGLNTREMTSRPASGSAQSRSPFSQFLQHTAMVTVTDLLCLNKHNWRSHTTWRNDVQWLTTQLWCGLEERNNRPSMDHHHLMPEMCSPVVLILKRQSIVTI